MRPSLPITHRSFTAVPTSTVSASTKTAISLPPGFQALHTKGGLSASVMQRLAERQTRPAGDQRRADAQGMLEDFLAAPRSAATAGGAMRV